MLQDMSTDPKREASLFSKKRGCSQSEQVVPNQNSVFQIRVGGSKSEQNVLNQNRCSKLGQGVLALEHRSKKLQSVILVRLKVCSKSGQMFQIKIQCSKSDQDVPSVNLRLKGCKFTMKIPMVFYARLGWFKIRIRCSKS